MITLRALEPEDLDLLYAIENVSDVLAVSAHTAPLSKYSLRHFLANTTYDVAVDGYVRLVAVDATNTPIGIVDLTDYAPAHGRAELGIALLPEVRGRGYSKAVIEALLRYATGSLHLRVVSATTQGSNEVAHRMLLSCGFEQVATLPQWYARGDEVEDGRIYAKFL